MRYLLFVLNASITFCLAQPCAKYGNTPKEPKRSLNIHKNAPVTVSAGKKPETISLNTLLPSIKRPDRKIYADGAYVTTTGYLISFEEQGGEACNCGKANKKLKTGDVHMYVGLKKNALKKDCIVVEITPAFKKAHPDYETLLGKNIQIQITGYLLYDFIHEGESMNTCTKCTKAWRRTCWEIHPVTDIVKL